MNVCVTGVCYGCVCALEWIRLINLLLCPVLPCRNLMTNESFSSLGYKEEEKESRTEDG